jgi:hypothetical protein
MNFEEFVNPETSKEFWERFNAELEALKLRLYEIEIETAGEIIKNSKELIGKLQKCKLARPYTHQCIVKR